MNWLNNYEEDAVLELKDELLKRYGLIQFKLFGSKVRGNFDTGSDIDLFIVLRQSDWTIEKAVYELCFEISLKYDVFLTPVVYSEKEVKDKLTKITPFYRNVEREGISI